MTLKIIAKFQFITVPLLSQYLGRDRSSCYEQLLGLVDQQYVSKRYHRSYRLRHLPARYYLTAKGLRFLKDQTVISDSLLTKQRHNETARPEVVEQCLNRMKVCNHVRRHYPEAFDSFTKNELLEAKGIIRPLPDLYLRHQPAGSETPVGYYLELLPPGVFSWRLLKRLRAHDDLATEAEYHYPQLLFVCANDSTERRLHNLFADQEFDIEVSTTTSDRLDSGDRYIWRHLTGDVEDEIPLTRLKLDSTDPPINSTGQ